jgi:hypothetical protein
VHAATCKSEEFNQFVQWVFSYNSGMIQENLRYAQDKMIAYTHLVANLVILHNVDSMSKAINKLKRQGFNADAEALRSLSPYRTEHINLYIRNLNGNKLAFACYDGKTNPLYNRRCK